MCASQKALLLLAVVVCGMNGQFVAGKFVFGGPNGRQQRVTGRLIALVGRLNRLTNTPPGPSPPSPSSSPPSSSSSSSSPPPSPSCSSIRFCVTCVNDSNGPSGIRCTSCPATRILSANGFSCDARNCSPISNCLQCIQNALFPSGLQCTLCNPPTTLQNGGRFCFQNGVGRRLMS